MQEGVTVAVHYYQNEAAAKETLAMVRDRGADGFVVQADVARPEEVSRMISRVQAEFGSLDIFVSNARPELPFFFQAPLEITLEQWDVAFNSQAKAFLVGAREASGLMGDGGRTSPRPTRPAAAPVACNSGSPWARP
ncbi:MAG TPA: SDR family oxidoreductase, partial [Roseiflexaceae bacterium]|nr:SDR family oxidoreductase [Roseiflexaceae bacterium]